MNAVKRGFFSLWYRKKTALLLFCVFLILAALVLAGFSMLEACRQEERALREQVGATVTLNNYHTEEADLYAGSNQISQESVEKIEALGLSHSCSPYYYSFAQKSETLWPFATPEQREKFPQESAWIRVEGTVDMTAAGEFVTGAYQMLEGRMLEESDTFSAVISSDMAQESGVSLGEEVTLGGYYTAQGGQDTPVTVVGIYALTQEQPHTNAPYFNLENLVYTTPDAALRLNGEQDKLYSARFSIRDPEQAAAFVEAVQALSLPEGEDLRFTVDDIQYRALSGTISGLTALAKAMLGASGALGAITLVLVLLIQLRSRDHEIGGLLALGEGRGRIYAQLLGESLVPILLAMAGAVALSPLTSQGVSWLFQGSLTQPPQVSAPAVLALFLSGLALTLCASLVTAHKLLAYQPKTILMAEG